MEDFEQSFDEFIDSEEYDTANSAIFTLVRAAFLAGWEYRNKNLTHNTIYMSDSHGKIE